MRSRPRFVSLALVTVLALTSGGCANLQDWQRDLLSAAIGGVAGGVFGGTRVIVERTCFENGVMVDCSQIPTTP